MNTAIWENFNGIIIPSEGEYSDKNLYTISSMQRTALLNEALSYYRVPGRYYHAQPHVMAMLNGHLDLWHTHPTDALFLAIIFHDAIYIPGESPLSEEMSMKLVPWMYHRTMNEKMPIPLIDKVFELIRWTMPSSHVRNNRMILPMDSPACRMLDLDLISMKDNWFEFVQTQRRIEEEYMHTGARVELKVRAAKFLKQFIEKGFVYYTPVMQEHNQRALNNLKALVNLILHQKDYDWSSIQSRDYLTHANEYA